MWEFYKMIVSIGADFCLVMGVLFIITGVLRLVWLYAFAERIIIENEFTYSSVIVRTLWRSAIVLGFDEADEDVKRPYGADVRGIGLDIGLILCGGIILFALWPITLAVLIGYFPIQTMHKYHAKKKEFVANLKGEQLEEA